MERIEKEIQELEKQVDLNSASNLDDEQHQNELSSMVNDEKDLESLPTTLIIDEVEAGANSLVSGTNAATSSGSSLANSNMKALMDSFITQLPNCVNRELIDKAAKEFCMNLNTKLNRKRLVGALFQVQRTRLDLLPFYSRFVAILNPCMPELSIDLSSLLLNDFRFHVRKKDQINIESKIKTARFIGELVKFNMFSRLDALNCLKTLLADFKHHNVEMACNLLDVCGRYLYRNQESHMKLKLLLEILMRKKQATSMDGRYSIMVENAFYYCNPPESKQDEKKVKSPIHEYIKKLLYKDLNKLNVEKVNIIYY
jgi:regulator of nonsense transcripts 2